MPPKDFSHTPEKDTSPDHIFPDVLSDTQPDMAQSPYVAQIDLMAYAALLEDIDATDEEKQALLNAISTIALQFIELAYRVGPAAKTCGQVSQSAAPSTEAATDMVDSGDPQTTDAGTTLTDRSAS